jgi:cholesterol transport system auxiliary component
MSKIVLDRRALLVASVSTLGLAACSNIIGPPESPPLYVLRPTFASAGRGPRAPWQLSVSLPVVPDSLDTDRIALVQPTSQMDYYANANWQDRLPMLVQGALLEAFEKSGRIDAVGRDTDGIKSDYLLLTDVRDFQARYDVADGAPTAVVNITAKLIAVRSRVIVDTCPAHAEVAASQNSVAAVAQAFNQALGSALSQIVDWALRAPPPRTPV